MINKYITLEQIWGHIEGKTDSQIDRFYKDTKLKAILLGPLFWPYFPLLSTFMQHFKKTVPDNEKLFF